MSYRHFVKCARFPHSVWLTFHSKLMHFCSFLKLCHITIHCHAVLAIAKGDKDALKCKIVALIHQNQFQAAIDTIRASPSPKCVISPVSFGTHPPPETLCTRRPTASSACSILRLLARLRHQRWPVAPMPNSRSSRRKWYDAIIARLYILITTSVLPSRALSRGYWRLPGAHIYCRCMIYNRYVLLLRRGLMRAANAGRFQSRAHRQSCGVLCRSCVEQ